MIHPKCGVDNSSKWGFAGLNQRHLCRNCGGYFSTPKMEDDSRTPKILLLDIETAPMRVFVWGLYRQRISPSNVISDYYIICWAAKWLCESETISACLTSEEAVAGEDKKILKDVWELMDKADAIIAHNGKNFDTRRLNARFIYHKMPPPMPYQVIDTLLHARRNFAFSSFKQAYITEFLDLSLKMETDFKLWKRCMEGDQEALDYMLKYCKQDIGGLEEMYFELRPWMKSHPNMAIFSESETQACPSCGHEDLSWEGFYTTPAGRYRAYRCAECKAIGRSRFNDLSRQQKSALLAPIAR